MTNLEPLTPSSKISASHLARLAYIYVRQSSPKQVERNRESQVYQYQMSERARALGWNTERTRVIDSDLGLSGKTSEHRDGFKELVAEVSLGHVGIIFGYEVSRLARNNADWYHLLDLAAVFGTLIADSDGIYDTRLYNDRLLLGLKGTMSEAELHLLRLRLAAGRMSQVKRGAYRQLLPTGLVRLPDNRVVIDPDAQVRHTIKMVFAKFAELGSCRQVLLYLKRESILLPRRHLTGIHKGQLLWKPPTDASVYAIICNPAYAGAFAYGRRASGRATATAGQASDGATASPAGRMVASPTSGVSGVHYVGAVSGEPRPLAAELDVVYAKSGRRTRRASHRHGTLARLSGVRAMRLPDGRLRQEKPSLQVRTARAARRGSGLPVIAWCFDRRGGGRRLLCRDPSGEPRRARSGA